MKKIIAIAALAALITGCTPATPEEKTADKAQKAKSTQSYIKNFSYEVCIRGNTYLYIEQGNASHALLILDKASKAIPCKD